MQKVIIFLLNVQLALRSAGWGQVLMEGHVQEGLAHVCLVGSSTTIQKAKIESSIPRKRGAAAAGYDKALQSFFNKVTSAPRCIRSIRRRQLRLNLSVLCGKVSVSPPILCIESSCSNANLWRTSATHAGVRCCGAACRLDRSTLPSDCRTGVHERPVQGVPTCRSCQERYKVSN